MEINASDDLVREGAEGAEGAEGSLTHTRRTTKHDHALVDLVREGAEGAEGAEGMCVGVWGRDVERERERMGGEREREREMKRERKGERRWGIGARVEGLAVSKRTTQHNTHAYVRTSGLTSRFAACPSGPGSWSTGRTLGVVLNTYGSHAFRA